VYVTPFGTFTGCLPTRDSPARMRTGARVAVAAATRARAGTGAA
jgi:hypothetical protein